MQNEHSGVNEYYPTDRGTAGRPSGRDNSPETSSAQKTPPHEHATARTGGCTGPATRPVEQSDRGADNDTAVHPDDVGVELLNSNDDDVIIAGDDAEILDGGDA
ncbi:hypothetical protein [Natronobacterium gregoryi]|uniref:Uncharacterized protein n=2 Tax=Natronobacterium gregoryi TaxID=44930 RepID=L0AGP6_NATGS|nr:hypothetical protein [Natronobacterium gregoryi]AFZ73073.1 hypothetical protein Natgr_1888 [Natronobacterium gregoryi SP2]ELY70826.1 hypothetical protein C490_06032 [Natronobacterium gregoryi SP2]PLK20406.1 hypothetical protein CYV19_09775 [Natronobacterium gregoryi SP2]SFI61922.1 hypothetical protein SAMN05443661_102193 [Natronobacterium gregoryi]